MKHAKPNRVQAVGLAIFIATVIVSFQNCGGMGKMQSYSGSNSASQCKPKISFKASDLACGDLSNYSCERRVFSPSVGNLSHSLMECIGGGESCVNVDVFEFNTSAARDGAVPGAFEPGGEYNREELSCHHRLDSGGDRSGPHFRGEGKTIEEALAQAMSACDASVEGP